jgi:hypothetical protein
MDFIAFNTAVYIVGFIIAVLMTLLDGALTGFAFAVGYGLGVAFLRWLFRLFGQFAPA